MDDKPTFTIGELARRAGVTPRTIRYYAAEGLLPPPDTRGRYAHYGPEHLHRLEQISQLKAGYLPLSVIRERLGAPGANLPTPLREAGGPPYAVAPLSAGSPPVEGGAAPTSMAPASGGNPFPLKPAPPQLGRYEFFPDQPAPLIEETPHERSAPPETWQRILLEPGIELHIREPLTVPQRRRVAAIIRAARDVLRGEGE